MQSADPIRPSVSQYDVNMNLIIYSNLINYERVLQLKITNANTTITKLNVKRRKTNARISIKANKIN